MKYQPSGEKALAHSLQRHTAFKIQTGHQGPQNGQQGLEMCLSHPRLLGAPVNFLQIIFLIRALLLWEK